MKQSHLDLQIMIYRAESFRPLLAGCEKSNGTLPEKIVCRDEVFSHMPKIRWKKRRDRKKLYVGTKFFRIRLKSGGKSVVTGKNCMWGRSFFIYA